jgi:hypothetical protein
MLTMHSHEMFDALGFPLPELTPTVIGDNPLAPCELSLERLLDASKIIYLARGTLPLNLVASLMAHGCIVEELENDWAGEA